MTQAGKVAEIFSVAGEAFTQLGNLAMCLQPASTQDGGKWEDEEIEMLRKAVAQFGNDIEKISEKIKTKSAMQIKNTLKRKAVQNLNVNSAIKNTNIKTQNNCTNSPAVSLATVHATTQPIVHFTTAYATTHVTSPQIHNSNMAVPTVTLASTHATNHTVVQITTKPGLKPIAVKPSIIPTNIIPSNMRPAMMTFHGQDIAVKTNNLSTPQQHNINIRPPLMSVAGQNLSMKSTGAASPAAIITSQLNKSPMKILNVPRTLGQKTKLDTISVSGMMSLAEVQNAAKKVKVDPANLNVLTSTLLSQKPLVRSQSTGISGVVSSQGFQVLMPSSSKNIYPISVRPSGVVQRVADANTTVNIDVET